MCGIAGFYRFSDKKPFDADALASCIQATHSRGGDAVGIYSPSVGTVKAPGEAEKFCKKHKLDLEKASHDQFCIIHNRKAASGWKDAPPEKNENNHPHESKDWVLIHNGVLSNSPPIKDYKYNGHCDSEIALSYLQEWGLEGLKLLCDDDGFALAFIEKKTGTLYLIRHHNPLVFAYEYPNDAIVFGSTVEIGCELSGTEKQHGIQCHSNGGWWSMQENALYKVTPKGGLELVEEGMKFVWRKSEYKDLMKKDKRVERLAEIRETTIFRYTKESEYGAQMGFFGGNTSGTNISNDRRNTTSGSRVSGLSQEGIDISKLYFYPTPGGMIYARI